MDLANSYIRIRMGCVSGERFGDGPAVLAMLTRVSCGGLGGVARSKTSLGA